MRFPVVRERVRVQGRSGTYLVLSVDRSRGVADLISTVRGGRVEENVPLTSILPLVDDAKGEGGKGGVDNGGGSKRG